MYIQNTATIGGGLLLVNSTVMLDEGMLEFTANYAGDGGGIYSNFSSVLLHSRVLFKTTPLETKTPPYGNTDEDLEVQFCIPQHVD